jgi:hypothetical protein
LQEARDRTLVLHDDNADGFNAVLSLIVDRNYYETLYGYNDDDILELVERNEASRPMHHLRNEPQCLLQALKLADKYLVDNVGPAIVAAYSYEIFRCACFFRHVHQDHDSCDDVSGKGCLVSEASILLCLVYHDVKGIFEG